MLLLNSLIKKQLTLSTVLLNHYDKKKSDDCTVSKKENTATPPHLTHSKSFTQMSNPLITEMIHELKRLSSFDFSIYDSSYFEKTLNARLQANNNISAKQYLDLLSENSEELERLKNALNNNFSEFFRNKFTFA